MATAVAFPMSTTPNVNDITEGYMQHLNNLILPVEVLRKKGYVLEKLSPSMLEDKKKCARCMKNIKIKLQKENKPPATSSSAIGRSLKARGSGYHDGWSSMISGGAQESSSIPTSKAEPECKFHSGHVNRKMWTCCQEHVSSPPCQSAEYHTPRLYAHGELEYAWQFHPTPPSAPITDHRIAVAIDCEMGTAVTGDSELIRITMIDYFTSEILVDKLVYPDVPMQHFNTRYSGVTAKQMSDARRFGMCFLGKTAAREECWKFVGQQTIVVGHSCENDLGAMRWIHKLVIDTHVIEAARKKAMDEAEKKAKEEARAAAQLTGRAVIDDSAATGQLEKRVKGNGPLALKTLLMMRFGRVIRNTGRAGHDSLEDAIGARDLAHWNVINTQLM